MGHSLNDGELKEDTAELEEVKIAAHLLVKAGKRMHPVNAFIHYQCLNYPDIALQIMH